MAASNALLTIERLLDGKTTLKTQRATHSSIICIGTELLNEIKAIMSEDKQKAINEAVSEVEKKAAAKLRSEVELITDILNEEKRNEFNNLKKAHRKEIADIKKRCKMEEELRAQEAYNRYQSEKEAAVKEAMEREQKQRDEFVEKKVKSIVKQLKEEARIEQENALVKQKKLLREMALKEKEAAISETRKTCERVKVSALEEMKKEYNEKMKELDQSIECLTTMLEIEKTRKDELQQTFLELKEDYKRFQNYTGRFHSDYLLS